MRDTNLHNKDFSEMHSGSCNQMTSSCKCAIGRKVITRRHNGVERVERVEQVSILATIALVPYTIGNQSQAMFISNLLAKNPS